MEFNDYVLQMEARRKLTALRADAARHALVTAARHHAPAVGLRALAGRALVRLGLVILRRHAARQLRGRLPRRVMLPDAPPT